MTAVYIDYRPGDEVKVKGSDVSGMVTRVMVGPHEAMVYEIQYWVDRGANTYYAYDIELELVEAYVER
jgi:hypothetical protein